MVLQVVHELDARVEIPLRARYAVQVLQAPSRQPQRRCQGSGSSEGSGGEQVSLVSATVPRRGCPQKGNSARLRLEKRDLSCLGDRALLALQLLSDLSLGGAEPALGVGKEGGGGGQAPALAGSGC